jgi:proteasome lid subunit RPN8/RPN11
MTGTAVAPKFATWSAPGHSFRIEYSGAVLEQIRQIAVEAYHRVPHGGVETGGILFGTQLKNAVRIKAWRPIACEYTKGPSFLLSDKEEAALAEALKSWRGDAELARLEPVGWYRAHTRSEILLSDADLAFFNRFFPQSWQVGLIVRPASFAATRAGFFFREPDGGIRAQSSYREFPLTPVAMARSAVAEEAPAIPEAPPATAPPEVPREVVAAPEPPPPATKTAMQWPAPPPREPRPVLDSEPYPPLARRPPAVETLRSLGARQKWYAASLTVLVVAVLGLWLLKPSRQGLKLSATDMGNQLRIAWDGTARSIGHAKYGSIEIDDHGVRTQVNLTPADLRSGSIFYARQSGDVEVWLTVYVPGSPPVAETTRFLRPGESGMPPAPRLDAAQKPEPPRQPEAKQARLETPPPAAQPPAAQPLSLRPPEPAAPARRAIPFRAPDEAPRQSSTDIPGIAPPKIENVPAAPPAGLTPVLGPVAAPLAAPAAPPRPATAAPAASGRIIWTGKLAKNGRLVVERNRASSGAISGALPAVQAHVSAYPGNLTAGGITLFTADPRYSQPLTEKAGADNGWNPTTYTWDPKRAAGIKVVEQPVPQNGYKLVLESDMPKLSVVVLEWRAIQ